MVRNRKLCVEGGLEAAGHYIPSLIIITTVFSLCTWGTHSKELHWKSACGDEELFLDCGRNSVIAIHEASFTSDVTHVDNSSCAVASEADESLLKINGSCLEDIRIPINRRCSGLVSCEFSYSNHTGRKCDTETGIVTIQYDCVKESAINKYCNVRIRSKEGYISSPGYPQFYPQLSKCEWEIQAGEGQTVTFRLLDIHMQTPSQRYGRHYCDDAITILEGATRRLMVCGSETESLQTLEADVDNGLVVQFTSQGFFPASGFLIYFKVQGCSTLPAPEDGYLVHRNGSSATYVCCQNYFFNDTQESSRTLQCVGEYRWNDTLAPCVAMRELKQIALNHSLELDSEENVTLIAEPKPSVLSTKASYLEDILVPSILMAALLLGNALIVAIILRIRRKQKSKLELEEEDFSPQRSCPEATNV